MCGLGTAFLRGGVISHIAKLLYKISFHHPRKIFFQNQEDLQLFVSEKLVSPEKSDVLPGSGINVSNYIPSTSKHNKKFTFLLVSRLIYDKGIAEYVEAIKILKRYGVEARFQLLGAKDPYHKSGIPLKKIERWVKDGWIEYLGKSDNVISYMNAADCVVLPSYREGSPRSLMEAASLQKPIITTNVAGCNQVVEDNYNGFLCELQNEEDLAVKMDRMIRLSDSERQQMGINGRRKMEREFSDTIVIKKYLKAIGSIQGNAIGINRLEMVA